MNYKKIFWGYLFLFDFRISGFDILPDIIGFILITIGLASLVDINDNYRKARSFAVPLIFLSVFDIYLAPTGETLSIMTGTGVFGVVMSIAIAVVSIFMTRGLLKGIEEDAVSMGKDDIALKARNRWIFYLVISIMVTASLLIPPVGAILIVPLVISGFLSYFLILMLLKNTEAEIWLYSNPEENQSIV